MYVPMMVDLLAQVRRGPLEALRGVDQGNTATDYGAKHPDRGCRYAPSCLDCPFDVCFEDDPYRPEFAGGMLLSRSKRRTILIEIALRAGVTRGDMEALARQFGVSTRTVFRIRKGMDL